MMIPCACRSDFLACPPAVEPGGPQRADLAGVPSCEASIGMVVFLTHKREHAEAILDAEGRWHCPRLPVLDRVLNALYEPGRDAGGGMPFGYAELIRVAAWLRGEVRTRR